jgi:hypothetical protein
MLREPVVILNQSTERGGDLALLIAFGAYW